MISYIRGSLTINSESLVTLWSNGIGYEVMVPATVMKALLKKTDDERGDVTLVIFHYIENNQSRMVPRLIGFTNEVEREFFELFITVADMGPKSAVRALSASFHSIAGAIESGNFKQLVTLPGIGEKKAKQIIATLQGKAGKFALLQDEEIASQPLAKEDIQTDAIEVLLQLGYRRSEAQDMVKRAMESCSAKTSEELIQAIYEQKLLK
ncbi:MAG TPA: Holliday junction branch migration protein RuvA [Armatimonadota bacterium]|nr:Holliday junction branch migration protein RuvA [Armatimonadota bacterium]